MNIHLTRRSERILKEHLAHGTFRSPEEVIERALETLSEREHKQTALSFPEFEAALDTLAEGSETLPVLSTEATGRADIYHTRD